MSHRLDGFAIEQFDGKREAALGAPIVKCLTHHHRDISRGRIEFHPVSGSAIAGWAMGAGDDLEAAVCLDLKIVEVPIAEACLIGVAPESALRLQLHPARRAQL